jgi:hypothetical protein
MEDLAQKKWRLLLPPKFQFKWTENWDSKRARKEAMLVWQLWHKVVAVNVWRGRILQQIDQLCPMCNSAERETVLHRFWSCDAAQELWNHATNILNHLANPQDWRL